MEVDVDLDVKLKSVRRSARRGIFRIEATQGDDDEREEGSDERAGSPPREGEGPVE